MSIKREGLQQLFQSMEGKKEEVVVQWVMPLQSVHSIPVDQEEGHVSLPLSFLITLARLEPSLLCIHLPPLFPTVYVNKANPWNARQRQPQAPMHALYSRPDHHPPHYHEQR